ncbi:MAG: heparan-alpha-glucosaminide N-acetyltransferase domain-containing protein [Acidobacteriaceae bacterium]
MPKWNRRSSRMRPVSLDVLRGLTIAFMILVNNGIQGYAYPALEHAEWNGWTPTDLVFPTFLFLVGVSIVFAFESRLARGASKSSLLIHTFRRASILFALGLIVNGFPHFPLATWRIYGVLQRIAICFLIAGILYLLDRRPVCLEFCWGCYGVAGSPSTKISGAAPLCCSRPAWPWSHFRSAIGRSTSGTGKKAGPMSGLFLERTPLRPTCSLNFFPPPFTRSTYAWGQKQ